MPTFQNFQESDEVGGTAAGGVSLGVIPHFLLLALLANQDLWGP